MRKTKLIQGMAGGHRSKKDYQLLILKAGKVVHQEKPITTFQAKALAYWWNSSTPFGVKICRYKVNTGY